MIKPDAAIITIKNRANGLYFNDRPFAGLVDTNNRAYVLPSDLQTAFNAFLKDHDITQSLQDLTLQPGQLSLEKFPHVPFDIIAELSDVTEVFNARDVHLIRRFDSATSSWTVKSFSTSSTHPTPSNTARPS